MYHLNGRKLEGEWVNGELTGAGRERTVDGRVFEGNFRAGQWHGQGVLTHPSGRVVIGIWAENRLIRQESTQVRNRWRLRQQLN